MECPWTVHGHFMACSWKVHGQSIGCPWTVHGQSMDCPWTVHLLSMDSPWTVRPVKLVAASPRGRTVRVTFVALRTSQTRCATFCRHRKMQLRRQGSNSGHNNVCHNALESWSRNHLRHWVVRNMIGLKWLEIVILAHLVL